MLWIVTCPLNGLWISLIHSPLVPSYYSTVLFISSHLSFCIPGWMNNGHNIRIRCLRLIWILVEALALNQWSLWFHMFVYMSVAGSQVWLPRERVVTGPVCVGSLSGDCCVTVNTHIGVVVGCTTSTSATWPCTTHVCGFVFSVRMDDIIVFKIAAFPLILSTQILSYRCPWHCKFKPYRTVLCVSCLDFCACV